MTRRFLFITFSFVCALSASAQDFLSKEEVIQLVLKNNFDIQVSELNNEIAENNNSIFNSGYLPTLSGNANISYNTDQLNVEFQDGTNRELSGAKSDSRTANLNLNWVLFNGFNRKYNIERNQSNLNISQLNAKATLETVMLNLFNAYYEVARNQQIVSRLEETLTISKERLLRTEYGFEYGRNTKLDVSNAQVDVNTDSINYLNAIQSLSNASRNLKLILAEDIETSFQVDSSLNFSSELEKEKLKEALRLQNVQIQLAQSGYSLSKTDTRISRSGLFPTITLDGGYSTGLRNNNSASFLAANSNSGVSYGASATWNLFDGGGTKTAIQNAKINVSIQEKLMEQTTQQVNTDFENAWSDYQNRLIVVKAQVSNLATNQMNFDRSAEQYRLGRISSLDFRTAQRNLLTAQTSLINARYDAKIAEIGLMQLTGQIQDAEF